MAELQLNSLLIVDDEVELMAALTEMLAKHGYRTTGFTSGPDALQALRECEFDLLLTDLMMPGMDGIALLKAGQEIDPNLAGIIMSGYGTVETAIEAMKIGAIDYVLKPFKMRTVLPAISRALTLRRLKMENLQLRETMAIYELSQAVTFALDLETILNKLADAALQQCQADEMSILLLTQEGDELYVAMVRGEQREHLAGMHIPFEAGIAGWVARNRTPITLNGKVQDSRFSPLKPRANICSAISMPMIIGNQLIGVLNVNSTNARHRPFTLGQVKALSILASTAASVLENTRLYGQVCRAEEKYRSIFDNAVEGIFQSSPEGCFLTANPAMARILGYDSPKELIASVRDIESQIYCEPGRRTEYMRRLQEQSVVEGYESFVRRKDGSQTWVSESARAVRDAEGRLLHYEGTVKDIGRRKRAEEALRASEERFRALIENSSDAVALLDQKGVVTFASAATPRVIGYAAGEFIGMKLLDLIHPDDTRRVASIFKELVDSPGAIGGVEFRYCHKRGSWRWLEVTSANRLADPAIQALVCNYRDATERKITEKDLEQNKQFLEVVVETAPSLMAMTDPEGRIVLFNHACEEVTGSKREEVQGRTIYEVLAADESVHTMKKLFAESQVRAEAAALEIPCRTKSGEKRIIEWRYTQITSPRDGQPYFLGTGIDVTERNRLQAQLVNAQKMESIGTLAGGIAHDFNNLLTGVNGYADLSLLDLPSDHPVYENLQTIRRLGDRGARLVQQLLTFARKQAHQPRKTCINDCISDLKRLLRTVVGEHIEIDLDLAHDLSTVLADEAQIEQALMNLCVNARDAMPDGGKLSIKTGNIYLDESFCGTHQDVSPGNYVCISVRDTGMGMDSEIQKRVFEPFFTTKAPGHGSGLGLAVSYGIIKQHNGLIDLESEVGRGTVFRLYLPAVAGTAGVRVPSEIEPPLGGRETILVVEDEASVRELIVSILKNMGYRALTAVDGEEALRVSNDNPNCIDLVLSDAVMPRLGGRRLYESLKIRNPALKFVFISGYSSTALGESFISDNDAAFLSKPFSKEQLGRKIREVLDKTVAA